MHLRFGAFLWKFPAPVPRRGRIAQIGAARPEGRSCKKATAPQEGRASGSRSRARQTAPVSLARSCCVRHDDILKGNARPFPMRGRRPLSKARPRGTFLPAASHRIVPARAAAAYRMHRPGCLPGPGSPICGSWQMPDRYKSGARRKADPFRRAMVFHGPVPSAFPRGLIRSSGGMARRPSPRRGSG